jgi:hypothetical protein
MISRRRFLRTLGTAAAAFSAADLEALTLPALPRAFLTPAPFRRRPTSAFTLGVQAGTMPLEARPRRNPASAAEWAATGRKLRQQFRDLRRHFVFEYYPWYGTNPWRHWDQWERTPPLDIAATSMPRLGPYDSRSAAVIEQHARWIAESGVGAINISWWGQGSYEDRAVPLIMDVMRDYDIHVGFHLEPYTETRVSHYTEDVAYLLREYGEKRRWDVFLLPERADGSVGPVFKSFRTIVPPQGRDCHGNVFKIADWVPDSTWRQQTDSVRNRVRGEFDRITLLADVSDVQRMETAGFDGMAIYDNYVLPNTWATLSRACSDRDLLFSFNVNPGFDGIALRTVAPDSCYTPPKIEPPGTYDWEKAMDRERAAHQSRRRIAETFHGTVTLQSDASLVDARHGFFIVYINSFNEWHEGHQFEPMKDAADLTAEERRYDYRNPAEGDYRMRFIQQSLSLLQG